METYAIAIIVVVVIVLFFILVKAYIKWTTGIDDSSTSLLGKTAIVTGANSGIGFETALEFAKRGGRVILACRNKTAAEIARDEIIQRTDNPNVVIKLVDFASLNSIRSFAQDINESEDKIHILVNNAGAALLGDKFTEDGLQIGMQVNYFASVLLTILLLDKLKQSGSSRIVNVASLLALNVILNIDDINKFPSGLFPDSRVYNTSKLCNILFTVALAERLKGTQVTTNCLHPGVIKTNLTQNVIPGVRHIYSFLLGLFCKSAKEGAQTSIYVSLSKDLDKVSGKYFADCKQKSHFWNVNKNKAEQLWQKTEELLKLKK